MAVVRYFVAASVLVAITGLAWRHFSGRWRWVAAGISVQSLVLLFVLADEDLVDSWEVVEAMGSYVLVSSSVLVLFLVPAVALWPSPGQARFRLLISIPLGVVWLLIVHLHVVSSVWNRWEVCLPPGAYYPPANGGPDCELGPL